MPDCDMRYGGGLTRILLFLTGCTLLLTYGAVTAVPIILGLGGFAE